jgi:hypothetical protein
MTDSKLAERGPGVDTIALGNEHTIAVLRDDERVRFRVTRSDGDGPGLEMEIVLTPAGPTVRVRAASLELEATDSVALRCKDFRVEASENLELVAGKNARIDAEAVHLEARVGRATIHANDDVQLLGEQVLLNCDRQPPMPPWTKPDPNLPLLPLAMDSGDQELLALLADEAGVPG